MFYFLLQTVAPTWMPATASAHPRQCFLMLTHQLYCPAPTPALLNHPGILAFTLVARTTRDTLQPQRDTTHLRATLQTKCAVWYFTVATESGKTWGLNVKRQLYKRQTKWFQIEPPSENARKIWMTMVPCFWLFEADTQISGGFFAVQAVQEVPLSMMLYIFLKPVALRVFVCGSAISKRRKLRHDSSLQLETSLFHYWRKTSVLDVFFRMSRHRGPRSWRNCESSRTMRCLDRQRSRSSQTKCRGVVPCQNLQFTSFVCGVYVSRSKQK